MSDKNCVESPWATLENFPLNILICKEMKWQKIHHTWQLLSFHLDTFVMLCN